MANTYDITGLLLLSVLILLCAASVSGLFSAEAHNLENAAQKSDIVVHGTVIDISSSGDVENHHPVVIEAEEVLRGNISGNLTIQVQGSEEYHVSTAANFTENEEVVVMLQEREKTYYMTAGYATKYEVHNNTVELVEPQPKNVTLDELAEIVENNQRTSETETNPRRGLLTRLIDFFTGLF